MSDRATRADRLPEPVRLLGVKVHPLTVEQLHAEISTIIRDNRHEMVLHVNVHAMNLAYEQPWFKALLNAAHLVFCDGAGVILGARLQGRTIPERITYADWLWELAAFAAASGFSLFFLGARPGVAQAATDRLRERYPDLRIVGVRDGYFDKRPGHAENDAVVRQINAVRPNILLVGFGMPMQERWLEENWGRLDVNIALTGGAVFDYASGTLRRAPRVMTDNGLEWLGRLAVEPGRLWRRYLLGNPAFLWRVLRERTRRDQGAGER